MKKMLMFGSNSHLNDLEKEISDLLGFDDTILFSSGFTANTGTMVGLIRPNNLLVFDKLNHASLIDGAMMSSAKMVRYLHSNMASLEKILAANADQYIDEAHATGIIGKEGASTLSHWGIEELENIIITGTLSKAIGTIGEFITASQKVIDYLRVL